jgi:bile acid-coenzyme A ligase
MHQAAGPGQVSFGAAIARFAGTHPEAVAVTFSSTEGAEEHMSWAELDRRSTQVARLLAGHGTAQGSLVVIGLPNSPEHLVAAIAAWKVGACTLPIRWDLPNWERDRLLAVAQPDIAVAGWKGTGVPTITSGDLAASDELRSDQLPDVVPRPAIAIPTGGSTGQPKIVIRETPGIVASMIPASEGSLWAGRHQIHLVASPLYHTNGFSLAHMALLQGDRIVLMEKFDAARAVTLIERHRVSVTTMVAAMLSRIARLPDIGERDLSSLSSVRAGGAACPAWVVRAWIDLIGQDRFFMGYGASERIGGTRITGREWLEHPGSVGRPSHAEFLILDDEGRALGPGQTGNIFSRIPNSDPWPPFQYRGAAMPPVTPDGFMSVGDLGWLDGDGYLYVADRRTDMIVSGGANVYPAEVEAALAEHPSVADVAVIGLSDQEWGRRVHAIVEPLDPASPPTIEALRNHCKSLLAGYKVPKSLEFVGRLPRTDAGKINHFSLVAAREGGLSSTRTRPIGR